MVARSGLAGGGTKIQTMTARAAIAAELRQRADLRVLTWPAFDSLPVDAVVTTRHGGVSSGRYATLNLSLSVGDEAADVLENRRRVAAALGTDPAAFVFAGQVHGATARTVSGAERGRGALDAADAIGPADALVTADPGTVLAILVADCVPVLLVDARSSRFGVAHAGWRGLHAGVLASALSHFERVDTVHAFIGPRISVRQYQVGPEVADFFRDVDGAGDGAAARLDDDLRSPAVEVGHDREHVVHRGLLPDVDRVRVGHAATSWVWLFHVGWQY